MKLLSNTKLILFLSILCSFFFQEAAAFLKDYLTIILIVMLSFSIKELEQSNMTKKKSEFAVALVFTNIFVLSTLYIGLSYLLVGNELYRNAMIIYGLMPPAVAVVSLGYLYNADMEIDLLAEFLAYVLTLLTIPVGSYLFLADVIPPLEILKVITLILVIPFILSRVIKKMSISDEISKRIVNLCIGLVIFSIVGFNIDTILSNYNDLLYVVVIFVILRILLLLVVYYTSRKYLPESKAILLTLFGTLKNGGAATAIAILTLGVESTPPLAIEIIFFSIALFLLELIIEK